MTGHCGPSTPTSIQRSWFPSTIGIHTLANMSHREPGVQHWGRVNASQRQRTFTPWLVSAMGTFDAVVSYLYALGREGRSSCIASQAHIIHAPALSAWGA